MIRLLICQYKKKCPIITILFLQVLVVANCKQQLLLLLLYNWDQYTKSSAVCFLTVMGQINIRKS
jgi:hypothetical protein